jgi:hypothetical protein
VIERSVKPDVAIAVAVIAAWVVLPLAAVLLLVRAGAWGHGAARAANPG